MRFLLQILKNKYFLATVVFLVWIFFFAQYDIISQREQQKELMEMKTKIKYLETEVERLHHEKLSLQNDSTTQERYAREKYFMSKPNEQVFVFDTVYSVKPHSKDAAK